MSATRLTTRDDGNAFVWLGGLAACRLLAGLTIVKSVALAFGPVGLGALAQVMGICNVVYAISGGLTTNALTVSVATSRSEGERHQALCDALVFAALASIVIAIVVGVVAAVAGAMLSEQAGFRKFMLYLAVVQIAVALGTVALIYASALGRTRTFVLVSMGGLLGATLATVAAARFGSAEQCAMALVFGPALASCVAAVVMRRELGAASSLFVNVKFLSLRDFGSASVMFVVAAMALPVVQTWVRADLAAIASWREVGLWQSVTRLSDAYMQVFGLLSMNLLLPRAAAFAEAKRRANVVMKLGGAMLGLYLCIAAALFVMRDELMRLAFSTEFAAAAPLVGTMLVADLFKLIAWLLVYEFIAAGRLWLQPAAEWLQASIFAAVYFAWPMRANAIVPVQAHLVSTAAIVVVLIFARRMLKR